MEFNLVGCLIGLFEPVFLAAVVVAGEADDHMNREM